MRVEIIADRRGRRLGRQAPQGQPKAPNVFRRDVQRFPERGRVLQQFLRGDERAGIGRASENGERKGEPQNIDGSVTQMLDRRGARDLLIELQNELAALDLARGRFVGEERTQRAEIAENVVSVGAANAVGQLNAHTFEFGDHGEQARIDSIGELDESARRFGTDGANQQILLIRKVIGKELDRRLATLDRFEFRYRKAAISKHGRLPGESPHRSHRVDSWIRSSEYTQSRWVWL